MGSIRLDWREAQGGDLPMVCATCGDGAVAMVERKLRTVRPGFLVIVRTHVTVLLPYCERHLRASWNAFLRVRATSIGQDGITLVQVAEDFIDAVEDYRENPKRHRRRREIDDPRRDEADDLPRVRRPDPASGTPWVLFTVLMAGLVVVVVALCGFGLLFINLQRGGSNPRGFNQPVGPNVPGPVGPPGRRW